MWFLFGGGSSSSWCLKQTAIFLGLPYEQISQSILSVNEKLPESEFRCFGKFIIQLNGYFYMYIHVSGQRQTGLEKITSSTSPGTMVHVMHALFVIFVVFENLEAYFSEVYMPVHTQNICIENATKMV